MRIYPLVGIAFCLTSLLALTGCQALSHRAPRHITREGPPLRGVNLGNALEAPEEGQWGVVLEESYFEEIARVGFENVRIPIRWSAHAAESPPYTIDPTFFQRVDWAIEQSLSRGLVTIINIHHYQALMQDPVGQKERFLALWRQIATHYQDADEHLYFEVLNEPSSNLNVLWNEYLQEAIAVIRESNPTRRVIVGPARWNNLRELDYLQLPEGDPNLIVTFHYYEPFAFTHQGAEWVTGADKWLGTKWLGSPVEVTSIRLDMDYAANWAKEHGMPLYLGEFGAYSKADMASRVRWTSTVAREAEARGISWAYWEFCAGFGVYDRERRAWRQELLHALIPEK